MMEANSHDADGTGPEGPHSPKKLQVKLKKKAAADCPVVNLDDSAKGTHDLGKQSTGIYKERELDSTQDENSENGSYAEGIDVGTDGDSDDDAVVEVDDSEEEEDADDVEDSSIGDEPEPVVEQPVFVPPEHEPLPPPKRGVVRNKSFEDESFPAPPSSLPRREVVRQLSFDGIEGRITICKAARAGTRKSFDSASCDSPSAEFTED